MPTEAFQELVGEKLSGVTFIHDYLQLLFNPPPSLNAYTPVTVRCGVKMATFGEPEFPNLLVAQLGKLVRNVAFVPNEALNIEFNDGCSISVSVRPSDYVGPKANNYFGRDNSIVVE